MYDVAVIEEGNWMSLVDDVKRFNGGAMFDAVLCLGNSFAHLPDFEGSLLNQRLSLRNFKELLKPGGILVIDHRNYDEILTSGQVPSKNIYYNVSSFYRATYDMMRYMKWVCLLYVGTTEVCILSKYHHEKQHRTTDSSLLTTNIYWSNMVIPTKVPNTPSIKIEPFDK